MKNMMRIAAVTAAACLVPCASAGEARVFPQLSEGTLPDTEVATNVALNVQYDGSMRFSISIDAANCTSNEVLVAVGCDADSDGDRDHKGEELQPRLELGQGSEARGGEHRRDRDDDSRTRMLRDSHQMMDIQAAGDAGNGD